MHQLRKSLLLQFSGLLLVILAACPRGGTPGGPAETVSGGKLYASRRCAICHGEDREGKAKLGPPLKGLAAHWTAEELVRDYFPDPVTYQHNNARLNEMLKTYSTMKMPPVTGDAAELRTLAEWLLTD